MAEKIYIGGELESRATGNKVADVANIKDKTQGDKSQAEINAETEEALAGRYTKEETYNKEELNSLITTPDVNYAAVTATEQTTAATDVLPATGEANTIYRVGSWDGSQYDVTCYSEYAWKGDAYVHLSTKSQIGEVFDISAYRATGGTLATFADLSAALDGGNNIPQSLQKGGMSVKFVQRSDNKYVQFRCMANSFTTDTTQWQGVDDEPIAGSNNLVRGRGIEERTLATERKLGNIDFVFNVSKAGEHSSNIDRFSVNIPAGSYKINLANKTAGSTGTAQLSVHYVGDSGNTAIGLINIGGGYRDFTAERDIDNIGFYMLSAGIGTMQGNIQFEVNKNVFYAACSTNASEAAKIINPQGYNLGEKVRFIIRMVNANTAENPTLNVAGTGAKAIIYNGVAASPSNSWSAEEVLDVYYSAGFDKYFAVTHSNLKRNLESNSDLDVPSVKCVKEEIDNIKYRVGLSIPLEGDTRAVCNYFGLRNGRCYKIILVNKEVLDYETELGSGYEHFSIKYSNGNSIENILNITFPKVIEAEYIFYVPNDAVDNMVIIGVRGESGETLRFTIEDVTNLAETSYPIEFPILLTDNVFDSNSAVSGCLDVDGTVRAADALVSDYIFCSGKEYFSTNYGGRDDVYHCFYTKNKKLVKAVASKPKRGIEIPVEAYYLRVTMSAYTDKNYVAFVNSSSLSSNDYKEYKTVRDLSDYVNGGIDVDGSRSAIWFNKEKESAIVSSVSKSPLSYGSVTNEKQCFAFSVITDVHSDETRFNRACQYADENDYITDTLALGDIINSSSNKDVYQNILNFQKPVLVLSGNHEVLKITSRGISGWTEGDLLSHYYSPEMTAHNGDIHESGKCYWYKDYQKTYGNVTRKLRIIGLHQFEGNGTGEQNSGAGKDVVYYSQEQIDWLIDRLDECDENTYVIILTHYAVTNNMTPIDCPFTPSASFNFPISGGSNTGGGHSMSDNEFIPKIVQAWIDGTTLNISCDITVGEDVTTINAVKNTPFTSHTGQFVGYISGHTHRDLVAVLNNFSKQYQFVFICTSADSTQQGGDLGRDTTGKSQDCFTIMSFDWFRKSINLIRIGADVTTDMRERKYCNLLLPQTT